MLKPQVKTAEWKQFCMRMGQTFVRAFSHCQLLKLVVSLIKSGETNNFITGINIC